MTTGEALPYEGQQFEGWETGAGLLDNEDITIRNAQFAFRAEYHNGQTLVLVLDWQTPDGESGEQFLPVGKGWGPAAGGMEAVHDSGKPKRISNNSAYGEWLARAVKLAGPTIASRGPATNAGVWIGTQWHVETQERVFPQKAVNGVQQEPMRRNSLVPIAFLGVADPNTPAQVIGAQPTQAPMQMPMQPQQAPMAPTPMPQQVAQPGPVAAPPGVAQQLTQQVAGVPQQLQVPGVDPVIVAAMQAAAVQCGDLASFQSYVYTSIPGVQGNSAAEAALLDANFYTAARQAAGV